MLTYEQLEWRRDGIGGSDAAKVLGKSKWGNAYDVYAEKMGSAPRNEPSLPAQMGSALEEMILCEYEKKTGFTLMKYNDPTIPPFESKENPFMLANLDGLFIRDGKDIVVEAKTTSSRDGWGEEGTNNIPTQYLLQVMHYCIVMDAAYADIIVLFINERKYGYYRYDRDPENEKILIQAEKYFWENFVLKKVSPEPTTLDNVKIEFKKDNGKDLTDPEAAEWCYEIYDKKQEIKEIKKEIEALEFKAKLVIADNSRVLDSYGNAGGTWTNQTTNRINQTRLKKERPDIAEEFTEPSESRVFRPKKRK